MGTQIWFILYLLTIQISISGVLSTTFSIVNKCEYTVWPGILSNAGVPPLPATGFVLAAGDSKTISAPGSWGGRFWGRTHCSQDSNGKFSCLTGDCGSDKVECGGNGAKPPATLAEFTLDGAGGLDFFDVSLVDGYNIPMLVVPQGGTGEKCVSTGCVVDLNGACPQELKVFSVDGGENVACKSACEAFNEPQYCCSGDQKSTEGHNTSTPAVNGGNDTMVYEGAGYDLSSASRTTLRGILGVAIATVSILQSRQLF
ncbi:hypothetical protein SDJN02_12959, partial [Cucurbita argyrosperma subsp. argyrosperma]